MTMMSNVIAFQPRPAQPHLRRPRLLVRAARAGLQGWSRKRDLRRVLKCEALPAAGSALARLRAEEERLEMARRQGQAGYDMHRHIMLLIAILAETAEAAGAATCPAPLTCP
ncbi:DUF6477 family protein [Paracoccus sp. MA]|uniref:DUF6477 family protein n=1 Tax=Paracoccus sp. MA TaxID=2895796 RepID=UPI001E56CCB8|nr:DUF6477 family protein [Paracoccus sp. MA]UFM63674.1 DUF6477 family protein [Paracoccus sp. MA]